MATKRDENTNEDDHGDDVESKLEAQMAMFRDEVQEMKLSHRNEFDEMKSSHRKEISQLTAALKASHSELKTLKSSVNREFNLVHRMALELNALCNRNMKNNVAETSPDEVPFSKALDSVNREETENLIAEPEQEKKSAEDVNEDHISGPEDDDDDEDDEDAMQELNQDTFSMIMIGRVGKNGSCIPMLTAWGVFAFQILSFVLILNSFLNLEESYNIFGFPNNVDDSTRWAELIAIFISVAGEEDSRTAVAFLHTGFNRCIFDTPSGIKVTKLNWYLSVISRGFEGFFDLLMTFLLIMRSEEVVDLLLNFTAIEFVSHLDDIAFLLSLHGFLGSSNRKMAKEIENSTYTIPKKPKARGALTNIAKNKTGCNWKTLTFFLCLLSLISGWIVIYRNQLMGKYSCKKVFVQLDDSVLPNLGALSGWYQYDLEEEKVSYKLDGTDRVNTTAYFMYCHDIEAWTLSYSPSDDVSACEDNWVVRSEQSSVFWNDLTAAASSMWYVRNNDDKVIIMDHFRLFCADCDQTDFCGGHGTCNEDSDTCECEEGRYGIRCDFYEPCLTLEVDTRYSDFPGYRDWSDRFTLLQSAGDGFVEINWQPVYFSQTAASEFDLILYTGRRWMLTSSIFMRDLRGYVTEERLVNYLENEFHAFWSNYTLSFLSDPVDVDTSTDAATPVGVTWLTSGADTELRSFVAVEQAETLLLCAHCENQTNPCQYGGICGIDNTCDCSTNGASGAMCQIPPVSNGFCDSVFNVPQFDFDGGDCCEGSCVSGAEYTCGQHNQYIALNGYCNCANPGHLCPEEAQMCWLQYTESIYGLIDSAESGTSLALSADGRFLAVGEPGIDSVQVFTTDGSTSVKIGQTLRGTTASNFGQSIAISGDGTILAVGASNFVSSPDQNDFRGLVVIFEIIDSTWVEQDRTPKYATSETGEGATNGSPTDQYLSDYQVDGGLFGSTLALNQYGNVIFISIPFSSGYRSEGIFVFERNETSREYFHSAPIIANVSSRYGEWGTSLSVAASGQLVAFDATPDRYQSQGDSSLHVLVYKYEHHDQAGDAPDGTPGLPNFNSNNMQTTLFEDFVRQQYDFNLSQNESSRSYQLLGSPVPGRQGIVSGDGQVLVVTSEEEPSTCQLYHWEDFSGNWSKRGELLNGTCKALNFDGSIVALGGYDSTIGTYLWQGELWTQIGNVTGSLDASVVLAGGKSGTGIVMAVGLPFDDPLSMGSTRGSTSLYRFARNSEDTVAECRKRNSLVHVELLTDSFPYETIWEIRDYFTGRLLISGGPYDRADAVINTTYQLPSSSVCAEFRIFDLGGDGICCENGFGSFALYFGGVVQKIGGIFNWSDSQIFGNCEQNCVEGESLFSLELTTDEYPGETIWALTYEGTEQILMQRGPYEEQSREYVEETCLPSSICANFTIFDIAGDGLCCVGGFGEYKVSWDGRVIQSGANFGFSDSVLVGLCSPNDSQNLADVQRIGRRNLVIKVTTELVPFNMKWSIYNSTSGGVPLLSGGLHNDGNTTLGDQTIQTELVGQCNVFEIVSFGNNGVASQFSLLLDGKEIVSNATFTTSSLTTIGNCEYLTNAVNLNAEDSISCSDELRNTCQAPADCAINGFDIDPVGENVLGIDLDSGMWETTGAYSISFGRDCHVQCSGSCYMPSDCRSNEMLVRLVIEPVYFWFSGSWSIESYQGEILSNGHMDDFLGYAIHDQLCVPRGSCTVFNIDDIYSEYDYYIYVGGENVLSGTDKFGFVSENVCLQQTIATNIEDTLQPTSSQLPQDCATDVEIAFHFQSMVSQQTNWSIASEQENEILRQGGPYEDVDTWSVIEERACIPSDSCTVFTLHNFMNYSLYLDGTRFAYGEGTDASSSSISVELGKCSSKGTNYTESLTRPAFQCEDGIVNCPSSANNASALLPSIKLCQDAELLPLGTERQGSTSNEPISYFSRCGDSRGGASPGVWYKIEGTGNTIFANVTRTGNATFDEFTFEFQEYDPQISVFSGNCDELVCVAGNDDACGDDASLSVVYWKSTLGTNYSILVHGYGRLNSGSYIIRVVEESVSDDFFRLPTNDDCTGATALTVDSSVTVFNYFASVDHVPSMCSNDYTGEGFVGDGSFEFHGEGEDTNYEDTTLGVWYSVVGNGLEMIASIIDPNSESRISVYEGSCDSLKCTPMPGDSNIGFVQYGYYEVGISRWLSTPGTLYYIMVHSTCGCYPSCILHLTATTLLNDCDDAEAVTIPGGNEVSVVEFNYSSTTYTSVPACHGEEDDSLSLAVWYSFTGTGEEVAANLWCESESYDPPEIMVFSGSCDRMTCEAQIHYACDLANFVTWITSPDITYHIVLSGINEGTYTLDLAEVSRTNDVCSDAIVLDLDKRVYSSTTWANISYGISECYNATESINPGVWFSVVGTGNDMEASVCFESSFDVQITVFSGDCDNLNCVAGAQDCSATWPSVSDAIYYIFVHGLHYPRVGEFGLIVYEN